MTKKLKSLLDLKTFAKFFLLLIVFSILGCVAFWANNNYKGLMSEKDQLLAELSSVKKELEELKNQDQIKINSELKASIEAIEKTYMKVVVVYEKLIDFRDHGGKTVKFDEQFAKSMSLLADKDYKQAQKSLDELDAAIASASAPKLVEVIPVNTPVNNQPPTAGYSRQQVETNVGNFLVSIVSSDLATTRVIVDTASASTCTNDCPVLPLSDYVSRSGAYAGINGSYFCPASYPTCVGKTNSFDLLVMNKNKVYFNSDNNVYSNNPGVIFNGGSIRFVTAVSQWGRDTSIDSMLSNFPLLVFNNQIYFGGDSDPKHGSRGGRSFVANKGSVVFIGVVHNATVAEAAIVLRALGMENALNLDDGGSTALWSGGYKVGPGRNIPNSILFVRK